MVVVTEVGLAVSMKSGDWETVTVKATEWLKPLEDATTVTVNVPVIPEVTVRTDEALPPVGTDTLVGLKLMLGPVGEEDAERLTVPEKLFKLDTVIVDCADPLGAKLNDDGFAEIEKSETVTAIVVDEAKDPLTPLTVTV